MRRVMALAALDYAFLCWLSTGWGGLRPMEPMQSGFAAREKTTFQKIRVLGDAYSVELGFTNFNQDQLRLQAKLTKKDVEDSVREFGFSDADLGKLDAWYAEVQKKAIAAAESKYITGKVTAATQAELDRKMEQIENRNQQIKDGLTQTLDDLAIEYRKRREKLYAAKGFRYKGKSTIEVDVPQLVKRNQRRMAPVSLAFAKIAKDKDYGMDELVGAVTSMAQTALRYEVPPDEEDGRTIGGILPPPKSFTLGQGDCDTKSALMGSILLSWPNVRVVGLEIPGHYLLGVQRSPGRGDIFIEHNGLKYVMIDPAGPAWIVPGHVGQTTEEFLASGRQFEIYPFN